VPTAEIGHRLKQYVTRTVQARRVRDSVNLRGRVASCGTVRSSRSGHGRDLCERWYAQADAEL